MVLVVLSFRMPVGLVTMRQPFNLDSFDSTQSPHDIKVGFRLPIGAAERASGYY